MGNFIKKIKFLKFIIITVILAASCQTAEYRISGNPAQEGSTGLIQTYGSLGFGIIELSSPKQPQCSDKGVSSVKVSMTAMDSIIHFFTGGIYTSRQITVKCVD